ncbi:outer membrane protein assembly factor BamD [Butyrivibrio hungatei]|uniref:Uncharacterized protein n=1 Tax=Butyrivibrio hungatei TaxID=185008 RepID=A0A1D9NZ22_9FIRM|nr:hypothetical protein [Butyrivibrio hungatei]AOZ95469.1 hypothetical protein bhn_I0435 [Butyrivibrio hungatei]
MKKTIMKSRFAFYIISVFVVSAILFCVSIFMIEKKYEKAVELYQNKKYDEAIMYFDELGYYKDAEEYRNKISQLKCENIEDYDDQKKNEDLEKNDNFESDDSVLYLASSTLSYGMINNAISSDDSENNKTFAYSKKDIVAVDNSGEKYTFENLIDKRVVLYYSENGYDVYFFGQFSDEGKWQGDCLINCYLNGDLVNSTKAYYDNGVRLKYEQVFIENGCCVYSCREIVDGYNTGDTWKYENAGYIQSRIDVSNLREEDLVTPEEIKNGISSCLLARYHGNTKDGYYEDSSGNSYIIIYYDDGKIKTLYEGGFHKGQFNDGTGNAWYITCSRQNNANYMYFKGIFTMGDTGNATSTPKTNLTYKDISSIVAGKPYETALNWDTDYIFK